MQFLGNRQMIQYWFSHKKLCPKKKKKTKTKTKTKTKIKTKTKT